MKNSIFYNGLQRMTGCISGFLVYGRISSFICQISGLPANEVIAFYLIRIFNTFSCMEKFMFLTGYPAWFPLSSQKISQISGQLTIRSIPNIHPLTKSCLTSLKTYFGEISINFIIGFDITKNICVKGCFTNILFL